MEFVEQRQGTAVSGSRDVRPAAGDEGERDGQHAAPSGRRCTARRALRAEEQPDGDGGGVLFGGPDERDPIDALAVRAVAESAQVLIEAPDGPSIAGPALRHGPGRFAGPPDRGQGAPASTAALVSLPLSGRHAHDGTVATRGDGGGGAGSRGRVVRLDEYARAVLYNGLGHYAAARVAAQRACEPDFTLLPWALAELVEASVRSHQRPLALVAHRRLELRARAIGSDWASGLEACARALVSEGGAAEARYRDAVGCLAGTDAVVAHGRVHLLYGEWLRRQGRRVDARAHLEISLERFTDTGMGGFADRARRELLATAGTARRRTDDARGHLTSQEAQIARLAGARLTNGEIGAVLFISARTVEWHLRKVFTKLHVSSRRELRGLAVADEVADVGVGAP